MRRKVWIITLIAALIVVGQGRSADCGCPPPQDGFLARLGPVGGWHPYGGGWLHWWPRCCFPCCGGPDDYCRKPPPRVCWPPYPPYYIWGPPLTCPQDCCRPASCRPSRARSAAE